MVDYLEINGQKHRVEVNWEAIELFEEITGKTIGEFDMMCASQKLPASYLLTWAYVSLVAGAHIDDKPEPFGRKELRQVFKGPHGVAFTPIFLRQYLGANPNTADKPEVKPEVKKKKKKWRWKLPRRKK